MSDLGFIFIYSFQIRSPYLHKKNISFLFFFSTVAHYFSNKISGFSVSLKEAIKLISCGLSFYFT